MNCFGCSNGFVCGWVNPVVTGATGAVVSTLPKKISKSLSAGFGCTG